MRPHWYVDGEPYCEQCAIECGFGEGDLNTNETDTPVNCSRCSRPCEYTLTASGVNYAIEQLIDALECGIEGDDHIVKSGYYKGMWAVEMLRDWAEDLTNYQLSRAHKFIVDLFLRETNADLPTAIFAQVRSQAP